MAPYSSRDIALFVIALFFPPAAVLVKTGCSVDLLINICLCALGAFPGIIHGFYIVHKYNDKFVGNLESGSGVVYQQTVVDVEEPPRNYTYGST